jgi:Nucleoside-diphosphate-sugar epimerases
MKVLVTGANGLLGHHVVFQLLEMKYEVNIIVRSKKKIFFDLNRVDVIEGNFYSYETLKMAAKDCDAIIHIAAVTATNLLHYEDYRKINVDASAQIIQIANELKINRMVFVSSANTIGYGTKNQFANESFAIQYPFSESFYARSKAEAEQLFTEASLLPDRHVIIINPTFMIGAFDTRPSSGKLMLMGFKKPIMFTPGGGKNFVAADAVARTVCNALLQGKNGERYLASGENLSFSEFYTLQKEIAGYRQFIIQIPDFLLIIIGKAGDIFRRLGIKTEISSMNLRQLIIREYYSNEKAKDALSLPATDLKASISKALAWFTEQKMA